MRALIVDDEAVARRRLARLLEAHPEVTIVGEAADGQKALDAIRALAPDLVFLDIRMPEMDGLEVAFKSAGGPRVIFVTAHDEYAVQAFEAAACDYLLKPVDPARLRLALARVASSSSPNLGALEGVLRAALGRIDAPRLVARRGDTAEFLDPRAIARITVKQGYSVVEAEGREYLLDETLANLEERLSSLGFVRTHRGELVNLQHVRALRREGDAGTLMLSDGQSAPVSRHYLAEVKRRLGLST
ncbi:MAG: response regulator [Acidobacteria bacterium]|nr:response regulator [Acidobacteriota bacterium]